MIYRPDQGRRTATIGIYPLTAASAVSATHPEPKSAGGSKMAAYARRLGHFRWLS